MKSLFNNVQPLLLVLFFIIEVIPSYAWPEGSFKTAGQIKSISNGMPASVNDIPLNGSRTLHAENTTASPNPLRDTNMLDFKIEGNSGTHTIEANNINITFDVAGPEYSEGETRTVILLFEMYGHMQVSTNSPNGLASSCLKANFAGLKISKSNGEKEILTAKGINNNQSFTPSIQRKVISIPVKFDAARQASITRRLTLEMCASAYMGAQASARLFVRIVQIHIEAPVTYPDALNIAESKYYEGAYKATAGSTAQPRPRPPLNQYVFEGLLHPDFIPCKIKIVGGDPNLVQVIKNSLSGHLYHLYRIFCWTMRQMAPVETGAKVYFHNIIGTQKISRPKQLQV